MTYEEPNESSSPSSSAASASSLANLVLKATLQSITGRRSSPYGDQFSAQTGATAFSTKRGFCLLKKRSAKMELVTGGGLLPTLQHQQRVTIRETARESVERMASTAAERPQRVQHRLRVFTI
ncbi:hypothetical protein Tco_1235274 [Tanacetum coccineum]